MALTIADLYASPDHYLHSFEGDAALFVPMDRAAYNRSIFLDARISAAGTGSMRIPLALLSGQVPPAAATGWIFHVAHCGSTLLARALDQLSSNLVLREPLALRQLAIVPDGARLAVVAAMLSKRYRTNQATIVKANVPVNFLLPELAARDPAAHAIFLYLRLDDYVLAILRSDEHRGWLRRVTAQLAPHLGDLAKLPDAERCAALWLAQMRVFGRAIDRLPHARTLDAEHFYAEPRRTLAAAARHLGVLMPDEAVDALVAGPLFATYSKNPALPFDNTARIARRLALRVSLAAELAQARTWVRRAAGAQDSTDTALAARDLLG